jgi:hypothetical protein
LSLECAALVAKACLCGGGGGPAGELRQRALPRRVRLHTDEPRGALSLSGRCQPQLRGSPARADRFLPRLANIYISPADISKTVMCRHLSTVARRLALLVALRAHIDFGIIICCCCFLEGGRLSPLTLFLRLRASLAERNAKKIWTPFGRTRAQTDFFVARRESGPRGVAARKK